MVFQDWRYRVGVTSWCYKAAVTGMAVKPLAAPPEALPVAAPPCRVSHPGRTRYGQFYGHSHGRPEGAAASRKPLAVGVVTKSNTYGVRYLNDESKLAIWFVKYPAGGTGVTFFVSISQEGF